jgi:hypothetical protein
VKGHAALVFLADAERSKVADGRSVPGRVFPTANGQCSGLALLMWTGNAKHAAASLGVTALHQAQQAWRVWRLRALCAAALQCLALAAPCALHLPVLASGCAWGAGAGELVPTLLAAAGLFLGSCCALASLPSPQCTAVPVVLCALCGCGWQHCGEPAPPQRPRISRSPAGPPAAEGPIVGLVGRQDAGPETDSKAAAVNTGCQLMRLVPHVVCARSHGFWILIIAVNARRCTRPLHDSVTQSNSAFQSCESSRLDSQKL